MAFGPVDDGRDVCGPGHADDDGRGEVEPRHRGATVGRVADAADGRGARGPRGVAFLFSLYLGLGLVVLASFLCWLLDLTLILYLVIFFLIAFFTLGFVIMAVGSAAVNDMREAQAMQAPLIIVVMLPVLWMPSRGPDWDAARRRDLLPPDTSACFCGSRRRARRQPAGLVVDRVRYCGRVLRGVVVAKVFRIGILMFGKPPDFKRS